MKHFRFIIAILLIVFVLAIIIQNHMAMSTSVVLRLNLLFTEFTSTPLSLYVVVPLTFFFGVLVTWFYGMIEDYRLRKEIRGLKKDLREKDKELSSLRNLPITSDDVSPGQIDIPDEP
ncbi:MAG: LapA family protein [Deltaproteobacteria bacterium]|nr:LapA family protein [Deltaproteobacteria bacterium]